jgi:hypothetical protein
MRKSFDDLTIADDFMFCSVMQDPALCKKLLTLVLADTIGTITELKYQTTFEKGSSKGVRLDVWAGDDSGKLYDIEVQTTDQKNLAKRLRYYQSAIDVSTLSKGSDYNDLPDTFIIFFCPFDYVKAGLPMYTFRTVCTQNAHLQLPDGTTKVILNSKAAGKEKNPELKAFLEYMNGKKSEDTFVKELEQRIAEIKHNDQRRHDYMIMTAFEADAKRMGRLEGRQEGIAQGEARGFADGAYQTKLETAKLMKNANCELDFIMQMTGLSKEEVEAIN